MSLQKKDEIAKLDKIQVLQPQQGELIRTFSNPVCKETFYSLPRIYGKKKRVPKLETSPVEQIEKLMDRKNVKQRRHLSSNQLLANSKASRKGISSEKAGVTQHIAECSKKNCFCHKNQQTSGQKTRKKFLSTYTRQMLLPQIRKFDLEDLESQHKVSMQSMSVKVNIAKTGLDRIIEQNQKLKSRNESPKNQEKMEKQLIKEKTSNLSKANNVGSLKNKYKIKPRLNHSKFEIEEESDEEKITDQNFQEKEAKNKKNTRNESARFKTEVNDSESPKSNNSISLTSMLFRGTKRQNTNFYDLNISEKSIEKKLLNRKPSQLSNGLFRIPEEDEYADYLRGYNNVAENFNIKKLARKPGFKIEKSQRGVYFGQFDNELRKHGEGVNVTDKEIFEGRYDRNVKTSGCERNIDGVYIGEFKNGLRSGQGIFKWNNGEMFEGKWENGMKNGFGIWKSPKGDYYEGEWVNNRQHGEGMFRHRTSTYKGEFKNFLKDGFGIENFINGDTYEGQYKQGKPHGKGRYQWHKSGYYEGQFHLGMREGRGKWVDQNGTVYQGYFKSDFKHGFGKQTYTSGERFEGQFFEGSRSDGKLFDKNNNFIEIKQEKQ